MQQFRYKAVSATGDTVEGEIEAISRAAAIERLRSQGHIPIQAQTIKTRTSFRDFIRSLVRPRHVSPKDLALFTRELETLLHAGLPLERALTSLLSVSSEGPVKRLIGDIVDAVRGGNSLAQALESHASVFPGFYIGAVRAGEASGSLDIVLTNLSQVLEQRQELRDTVRSALQYPMVVLLMAAAALAILLTVVVPEFRPLFEDAGAALPLSTQVVVSAGDLISDYWWLMAVALAVAITLARWYNSTPSGRLRLDRWLISAPIGGDLVKKLEAARFSRTLGMLLSNDVSIVPALSIVLEAVNNRVTAEAIAQAIERVKAGEGLARPLSQSQVFPPLAIQLIEVGEETGQLEKMLLQVAAIYEHDVKRSIENMMTLLVPVITIFLGIVVAAVIGSMLAAILSAYDLPI